MDKTTAGVSSDAVDLKTETEQSATSEGVTETDYTSGGGGEKRKTSGSKKSESKSNSSSNKKDAKRQKKLSVHSGVIFEPCVFGKSKLWLPQVFTTDMDVFLDVLSMSTWEEQLTAEEKSALTELLPTFEENNEDEQKATLRQLFHGENFRFGNPLCQFGRDLGDGRYRVENVEKQRAWDLLQREEYRLQNSHRLQTMLPEVIIKRQELLEVVQFTSPSEYIRRPQQEIRTSKIDIQGKQKYEQLLEDLSHELGESLISDDDDEIKNGMLINDDDDPLQPAWEDRLHTMFDSPTEKSHCTITPRPVEADTINGDIEEVKAEKEGSKPDPRGLPAADVITEKDYMKMLERLQIVKEDGIEHPEFIFSHISLRDIINRTYPVRTQTIDESAAIKRKQKRGKDDPKTKKKKRTPTWSPKPSTPVSVLSFQDSVPEADRTGLPLDSTTSTSEQPTSILSVKLEEGTYPDTHTEPAALPCQQEINKQSPPQGSAEVLNKVQYQVPHSAEVLNKVQYQVPHSAEVLNKVQYQVPHSFFALLRKHFSMAMNHKLWVNELQEKVSIWEKSPVSALCPWRPLQLTWSKVVENTLYFLCMEEQGKLVNYVEEEDAWVWPDPMSIPNDELTRLFKRWLDLMLRVQPEERIQPIMTPVYDREGTIPEPRMYTDYTVKASTEEDIQHFRVQELQRFSEPHKPFTYVLHGYESVVGPVKGITPNDPLPASKGREHSLLISDRPSYVTILSLVRDAVARLPNGEGTKIEICHLLRDSQFIASNPEPSLLAAVSGALDRLHNEKDPSVKFDSPRKLWVYLHRNRSVQDFERIQMEQILAGRTKRAPTKPKQVREPSLDLPMDLTSTSSDSAIGVLEHYGSPGYAGSISPRSPRSSSSSTAEVCPSMATSVTAPTGILAPIDPSQGHQMDPNLSTIQSLISESLIKSQLLKKPRSKTPPASLGRSSTFAAPSGGKSPAQSGGLQRSLSIPAAWPKSAAGEVIPCDALVPGSTLTVAAPAQEESIPTLKKPLDPISKPRANSPRTNERKNSGAGKTSGGGKSRGKGEKSSRSSKASGSEKKSQTVQLKSGAITVTLPSSALKGQTVRSILASAASITIGKKHGEEQSHPTVQAVRKRLMAEKGHKTKHAGHSEQTKMAASQRTGQSAVPTRVSAEPETQRAAGLPAIIFRPNQSFIGHPGSAGREGFLQAAQIASQPLALVGTKPTGIITGLAAPPTSKQMPLSITGIAAPPTSKPIPLSLVVSGSASRGSPTITKQPFLQQGIQMTSLAPGQNIILQMPDGSKFVTSIPANNPPVRRAIPVKIPRRSPATTGNTGKAVTTPQLVEQTSLQQAGGLTLKTSTQNFYDFGEEQDSPSSSGQSGTSSIGSMQQGQTIPSNPPPAQTFALNLVTKSGEELCSEQHLSKRPVVAQMCVEAMPRGGMVSGSPVSTNTASGVFQAPAGTGISPGVIKETPRGTAGQQAALQKVTAASPTPLNESTDESPAPQSRTAAESTAPLSQSAGEHMSQRDMSGEQTGKIIRGSGGQGVAHQDISTPAVSDDPSGYSQGATMIGGASPAGSTEDEAGVVSSFIREHAPETAATMVIMKPLSPSISDSIITTPSSAADNFPGAINDVTSSTSRRIVPLAAASTLGPKALASSVTPDTLLHSVANQRPTSEVTVSKRSSTTSSSWNHCATGVSVSASHSTEAAASVVPPNLGLLEQELSAPSPDKIAASRTPGGECSSQVASLNVSSGNTSSITNTTPSTVTNAPTVPTDMVKQPEDATDGAVGRTQGVLVSTPVSQGMPVTSPRQVVTRTVKLQEVQVPVSDQCLPGSSTPSSGVTGAAPVGQSHTPSIRSPSRAVRLVPAQQTGSGINRSSKTSNIQGTARIIRQLPPRHQAMSRVVRQMPVTQRVVSRPGVAAPQGIIVTRTPGREGASQLSTRALARSPVVHSVTRTVGSPSVVVVSSGQSATGAQPATRPLSAQSVIRAPSIHKHGSLIQSSPSRGLARRGLTQTRRRGTAVMSSVRVAQRPHSSPGILRKSQDPSRKTVVINPPLKLTQPDEYARTVHEDIKRRTGAQQRIIRVAAAPSRDVEIVPQDLSVKAGRKEGSAGKEQASGGIISIGASIEGHSLSDKESSSLEALGKIQTDQEGCSSKASSSNRTEGRRDVFMSTGPAGMDEKEGPMKTAKLIKSQELADAVSGDLSEQGGQEQT